MPFTRFGFDNVSRKTIEVCSNADSITLIGTSSVLPILQLQDIFNDGINDFNSPVAYTDINYILIIIDPEEVFLDLLIGLMLIMFVNLLVLIYLTLKLKQKIILY